MDNVIDENFKRDSIYGKILALDFVYQFEDTDRFYIDKINANYNINTWILYIEGEIEKRCKKGILICKDRIIMKNDRGILSEYLYDDFSKISIGFTENCFFINGDIITIPGVCNDIGNLINEIKALFKNQTKKRTIQIRSNINNSDSWFYTYREQIYGPYSKDNLISSIRGLHDLRLIMVWNSSYNDWRFADELEEFSFLFKSFDMSEYSPEKKIDINECTLEELIQIDGVSEDAANEFIMKREEGFSIKNKFEFQRFFNLKPHQVQELEYYIVFKTKMNKKVRRLDI